MALALVRDAAAGREDLIAIRGYEPVREPGRGGQGVVYLVRHTDSGEARTLEVLPAQVAVAASTATAGAWSSVDAGPGA